MINYTLGFQTLWMARPTLEGRESPLHKVGSRMRGQHQERVQLERWAFGLFPDPPERVPQSQGDEVIKLKDPGASPLVSVGA